MRISARDSSHQIPMRFGGNGPQAPTASEMRPAEHEIRTFFDAPLQAAAETAAADWAV